MFFIENPQSKQAILEIFTAKATEEQLATVLPHIHVDNKYRKDVQDKVARHIIGEEKSDDVVAFIEKEKDKGLDMKAVWSATIFEGRDDVANHLEQRGFVPPSESLAGLLARAC